MALTLEEFLPKARQLNPDYTDDELIQAYQERYRKAPTQTVSPAPLMTLDEFLPKARTLNPDYSDEELTVAWQEKYGARGAREKDQGDAWRGVETAFKQIPQTVRGLEAGAGAIGEKIAGGGGLFTALKEHGLKGYQEHAADIAKDSKPSDSVTDAYKMAKAGDAGALVDWLQYALGYGGGQALQMLATAGIGYAGGKLALQPAARALADKMIAKESARLAATGMAGEQLAKQAVSNVAGKIGQTAALAGTAVGMEGGEIYGGLVEKAAQEGRSLTGEELARATGATLGAGALEFVGDKIGLDLILGKSVAGKLVSSRLGHAAAAGSLGVATEGGTEFTQTLIEEFGKGNDPLAPESIKQAVDAAALGGVGGGAVGTVGGIIRRPEGQVPEPVVTERQPDEMGMQPSTQPEVLPPQRPAQIEGPIQPGEVRGGKVYAPGEVLDVSPLPDVSPVLNASSLDDAIANAVGVVRGATETGKARAAEFARMTAKAKNETDALLAKAPEKRAAFDVPTLPGPETQPATLLNQPSPIVSGQAFTPRVEPVDDPRARLAEERARMVAQRERQRMQQPVNPVSEPVAPAPAVEAANTPLPSQIDLAYPSSKQVRDLIHEKGLHLDTPVFREILKQTVKKEKFADLTPQELQTLAEAVQKIKAPQQPTPLQEAPPQVPLTPTDPKEKPYAPVMTIPEAQVPRSELPPEKNAEILLRAEKAKADLEIAGTERGGRFFQEQTGAGSTQEVTGLKSATADWYKELTSGPSPAIRGDRKQSAREKIEQAIQKIIKDKGADRGKAVEQVKAALLQDTEFHQTEWGRDLNSIMQGEWPSWIDKPQGVTQATENAQEFQNVPRSTPQVTVEEPKKVPLSRKERLAQQKQKMEEAKGPSVSGTASPEREPAPPAQEAAPTTEEPFSLSSPEVSTQKAKETGLEQLSIDVPPPTIGERPIIGREATLEEAPLFSKNAQTPDAEQTAIPEEGRFADRGDGLNDAAKELRRLSHVTKKGDDVMLDNMEYVSFNEAARIAREGIESGQVRPHPFQLNNLLGIAMGDAPRVLRAAQQALVDHLKAFDPKAYAALHERNMRHPERSIGKTEELQPKAEESAQSIAPDITPAQSKEAQSENPAQSPTEILATALRTAADQIEGKQSIVDVGEKVGGARKDLVGKSEEKATKPKPEGPAWERRYKVSQIVSSRYPGEEGKWTIRDTKKTDWKGQPRQVGGLFDTEEEAKRMIPVVVVAETHRVYKDRDGKWEIFKKSGDRKLIHVVNQKFDTEEDAERYLAQNAAEILETKTFFGEEILPRPEKVERIGTDRRNGRNVNANDFKGTFGFRAVEFGNWQNQDDRQELMNYAYDGLHDLAETLKIPPRAIGLNGDLALAFGSRGHGLSGAAAHYERNYGVINLTKMQGAGHLAHEWFHAADHYFGRQDTKASSEKEKNERGDLVYKAKTPSQDYASHGFRMTGSQVRPEVRSAYKTLIRTMLQKGEQFIEDAQRADKFVAQARERVAEKLDSIRNGRYGGLSVKVEYGKRNTDPATAEQLAEFDAIAQRILEGETFEQRFISSDMAKKSRRYIMAGRWSNDALEKISSIYKAVRGRSGFGSGTQAGILDDLRQLMNFYKERLKMLADAQAGTEKTKQVPTSYAMEAKSMDQGRKESYWATEHEMAARAFAAYVEDKLKADGKKSDFITYQTFGAVPTIWGWKKPYPEGGERQAINEAFDKFIGVLQTKETDKGIALFEERNAERAEPTMAQFAQAFKGGVTITGTNQKIIDSSQEFPKEMIKALSTKRYVRQLTAELGKVFNAMKRVLMQSDPETFKTVTFAALSPDSYYYGVNLRGPDQMILNPWTALHQVQQGVQEGFIGEEEVPEYLAGNLIKTLVHEFTHQQVTTTHQDERQPYFLAVEQRNRAILGSRLAMMQRQLMAVLTGGTNGTVEGIRADLTQQQAFWKEGDGLSAMDQSVSPEPSYARRRQGVSGEGASGRTGPPTYLRGGGESETIPLDESPGLRRSGADVNETGTIDPTDARDRLSAVKSSARPYLLGALGLEQLSQVYGNDHAEVKAYNKATQAMEADFTEMSRDSDKVARAWTDLNIPVADKMARVMEDARFLNFDPDPKKSQEIDSEKKQKLRDRFEQLPEDAKSVYRMARDFYTNMAEQRFQALKERIERAGGTPENTRKLVDRLQVAYEQVRSKVYFPFSRFGEHIVVAKQMKDGKEVDREVHAFESSLEAQKFATMMKLKGWQVKQTVAREYSVDKEGPASKIVRQMHDIIKDLGQGQQGLPGVMDLENQLLDSLNQSFLQALPDMSYAKHFIHAKDVKGASKDALRAFAHSALHGAHHISRIRHADKVTKALMDLDENITKANEGDMEEARQVYNELVRRHNDIMNPNTHPFSAWLGQLGFTMSLGGVVATGITNATQVPLVTYPWLGARYGFGKASSVLARAYKDFLDPRTLNKDSLFDATKGKLISESERKMLLELAKRGHIDLTQTMDLAGLSSRDNLSRKARTLGTVGEKVTRMLGFTFHVPEVMNRQVTAIATFRLEKEKGSSFDEALERAQQAIQDTHFIYQAHNRPRYMSGNFLRVLLMFKQYSQNIAYTYGRAASIWLDKNNATKEERAVAKRQLLSMLALQFGAAGALGMPFFGTPVDLLMAVVAAMGDDDDKRDWEVALRQWLDGQATSLAEAFIDDKEQARAVGKELAEVVAHGASRLTPFDMASRLGQNDLFFREPQREREGRQAVMDWGLALGGPVPSYFLNALLGISDVAKGMSELNAGFFMRGVEELTPAVLRHGVRSLRYTLEGVRTRDEYKQLDLTTSEKLGQAFGFQPARVAEMYESTTAVKNKEHRILNEQKDLKNRFARAVDDQDDNAKQRILEDIRGFNERNPMFAITSNTLNRSLKARRQHEAGMERGLYLPPRRRALMDEGEFGDF